MPFVAILAKGTLESLDEALKRADDLSKKHNVLLQLVDAKAVYNERHLASAHLHAVRAQRQGKMSANTLGAEFLLYLTGQRQVQNALKIAGLKDGAERAIVVADGDRAGTAVWGLLDKLGWSRDPAGIPTNPDALATLGIPPPKVGTPEDAVLERVALLDVQK